MPSFAELARDKLKEGNQVMEVEQRLLDSQVGKIPHSMDVHGSWSLLLLFRVRWQVQSTLKPATQMMWTMYEWKTHTNTQTHTHKHTCMYTHTHSEFSYLWLPFCLCSAVLRRNERGWELRSPSAGKGGDSSFEKIWPQFNRNKVRTYIKGNLCKCNCNFSPKKIRVHAGIDEMDLFFNIDMNDFLDVCSCVLLMYVHVCVCVPACVWCVCGV